MCCPFLICLATEIHISVKRALQSCCQQLRSQLMHRNAIKDAKTRRSKLIKYVPDVSRSLFGLLDGMRQRRNDIDRGVLPEASPHKKLRLDANISSHIIQKLDHKQITEDTIHSSLVESIDTETPQMVDVTDAKDNDTTDVVTKATMAAKSLPVVPLYIIPLFNLDDPTHDIQYPQFTFRPIIPFTNAEMGT
jgi:hypothetical protein